ncbi:MAG: hypothetical protein QM817_27095 [Archangium sp.]
MRFSLFAFLLVACAPIQRVQLMKQSVRLDDGRFVGPVEIKVPRHADHQGHDFEVRVTLVAQCDPLFTLAWPDGEQRTLGVDDLKWQDLLRARAGVSEARPPQGAQRPPPPPRGQQAIGQPVQQQPQPQQPEPDVAPWPGAPTQPLPPVSAPHPDPLPAAQADGELRIPAPTVGHWQATQTESWSGQFAFEAERAHRCSGSRTFTAKYVNAFDDTNTVAIWADVPQELAGAELTVELTELIPPAAPPPAEVKVVARVETPKPPKKRPPQPGPKTERPRPAQDANAKWSPGYWAWREGDGEWIWVDGYWLQPATAPALRSDNPGNPPLTGCRWVNGHWVWVGTVGGWEWVNGHWDPPPPLDEPRVDQPDPTAPWISGSWMSWNGSFRWQPGRWGRPQPRAELQTPCGTHWISGEWMLVAAKWIWSPGFCAGTERPPPPKNEVQPPRPHPNAVWLAGFWRWDVTTRLHVWIEGHWELPPGENYIWVEEKIGSDLIIRGHWELRVVPR